MIFFTILRLTPVKSRELICEGSYFEVMLVVCATNKISIFSLKKGVTFEVNS